MKVRNGFVSNSSSSSFIIGVAKVKNVDQVRKLIKSLGLSNDASIKKASEFDDYEVTVRNGSAVVESFNYYSATIDDVKEDDNLLVLYSSGDGESLWNDEWEEYNYDVDLDHFDESAVRLFEAIINGSDGLEKGDATYGAGYNG